MSNYLIMYVVLDGLQKISSKKYIKWSYSQYELQTKQQMNTKKN